MFALPPPQPRQNHRPSPESRSYDNYASRTVEPNPEPLEPLEPPGPPPPVYTSIPALNRAPSYTFDVEDPPPYAPTSKEDFRAGRKHRVLGIKVSTLIAFLALFIAGAVIAGGIYGYQNRQPQQTQGPNPV